MVLEMYQLKMHRQCLCRSLVRPVKEEGLQQVLRPQQQQSGIDSTGTDCTLNVSPNGPCLHCFCQVFCHINRKSNLIILPKYISGQRVLCVCWCLMYSILGLFSGSDILRVFFHQQEVLAQILALTVKGQCLCHTSYQRKHSIEIRKFDVSHQRN